MSNTENDTKAPHTEAPHAGGPHAGIAGTGVIASPIAFAPTGLRPDKTAAEVRVEPGQKRNWTVRDLRPYMGEEGRSAVEKETLPNEYYELGHVPSAVKNILQGALISGGVSSIQGNGFGAGVERALKPYNPFHLKSMYEQGIEPAEKAEEVRKMHPTLQSLPKNQKKLQKGEQFFQDVQNLSAAYSFPIALGLKDYFSKETREEQVAREAAGAIAKADRRRAYREGELSLLDWLKRGLYQDSHKVEQKMREADKNRSSDEPLSFSV